MKEMHAHGSLEELLIREGIIKGEIVASKNEWFNILKKKFG